MKRDPACNQLMCNRNNQHLYLSASAYVLVQSAGMLILNHKHKESKSENEKNKSKAERVQDKAKETKPKYSLVQNKMQVNINLLFVHLWPLVFFLRILKPSIK